ncbi:site-specific recombinase [Oxalobacteraceae bacterium GrIS 1.11]
MKKILPTVVLVLLAIAIWRTMNVDAMIVNWNGDELGGPAGALFGVLLAGGGLVFGLLALLVAALFAGLLVAGLGMLLVGGMALLGVLLAALLAPFLLPLLIPLAIVLFMAARIRKNRHADAATRQGPA